MAPAAPNPGLVMIVRLVVAAAFTAFIGWYAVDFALTRGSTTVEFAVWLWVALLGWLVVVVGILDARPDLGEGYHRTRAFERSGRLYRVLGVPFAKRFMPNGDYAIRLLKRVRPGYHVIRDRETAARWERVTRSKEASHLLHLATTVPLAAYLLVNGAVAAVLWLLVLDIVFDVYPVLVQRYNRMRIQKALGRPGARTRREPALTTPET